MHMGVKFVLKSLVVGYAYSPGLYLDPTQSVTIGYNILPAHTVENPPQRQAQKAGSKAGYGRGS